VSVETHLWVVLDEDGLPARAYHSREAAERAVGSDAYGDHDLVDVVPDVPLLTEDDAR